VESAVNHLSRASTLDTLFSQSLECSVTRKGQRLRIVESAVDPPMKQEDFWKKKKKAKEKKPWRVPYSPRS